MSMVSVGGVGLPPIVTEVIVNTSKIKQGFKKVGTEVDESAKQITGKFGRIASAGNKLSSVGGTMTKYLTVPMLAAGAGLTKLAINYEKSFAKVSTLLDSSKVNFNEYKKNILKASTEAKVPVEEFSEAVYNSISAGVDQTKAIKFTTEAMKLAKGGFTDGAKAVDILTTAINGYKLKAKDANKVSDMLITTQNLGKTTVDELASSMGKVIPTASAANFKMSELSTAYAVLTKNGIATAESGTYLRAMLSELTKSGSETDKALRELSGKGFADLKKEGKSTSEIFKMLNKYAKDNGKTLKDLFGSVEAGSAAMVLASGDGKEFNDILKEMNKSAGSTNEAFKKMNSTKAAKMADMLNRIKNKSIEMGEKLLPVLDKIVAGVEKAVNWFTSLDDSTQSAILKFGAFAMAAGPVLKVTGGLMQTVGKLPKAISLASKGMGLLGLGSKAAVPAMAGATKALGGLGAVAGTAGGATGIGGLVAGLGGVATAAAPFVAGAAVVAGGAYLIHKGMEQKATPAVNNLKDGVITTGHTMRRVSGRMVSVAEQTTVRLSAETKKQMKAYYDLSEGAQKATIELFAQVRPLTDENITSITTKVEEMAERTKTAIENQKNKNIADYQELFGTSTTLTADQKAKILEDVNAMSEDRKTKVENMASRIIELYGEIKNKGVENATEEKQELDQLYQEMSTEQIRAVTQSKNEQELLIQNLADNKSQVTSKMVEDTIQKLNRERDEGVKAAEDKYDQILSMAARYKTDIELSGQEMTASQRANYDAIVEGAKEFKKNSIKQLEDVRTKGINSLKKAYPELTKQIDTDTGKQMSFFQKLFKGAKRNAKDINGVKYKDRTYTITRNEVTNRTTNIYTNNHKRTYSHRASGIDNVPYDGYRVHLHRGERVLTEKENKEYSSGTGKGDINIRIEKVENNTKEDVRNLVRRIGDEMKRQKLATGGI
ncbi:phage tail tape measure protein [Eubacteriales bacterium KG125]